jgi:hypothetical protein
MQSHLSSGFEPAARQDTNNIRTKRIRLNIPKVKRNRSRVEGDKRTGH